MSNLLLFSFHSICVAIISVHILLIGALTRFGAQLRDIKPRFPCIRTSARGAIGTEIKNQSFIGITTRPNWQRFTIAIASLGEVDPVALRYTRHLKILCSRRYWWAEPSDAQSAEYEADLA